jgi:hypothetical protein
MRFIRISALGLTGALQRGIAFGVIGGCICMPIFGLGHGALFGSLAGATIGLRVWTAQQVSRSFFIGNRPESIFRAGIKGGFWFGILYGIVFGSMFSLVAGRPLGLAYALPWTVLGGLGGYLHHMIWRWRSYEKFESPPPYALLRFPIWCDAQLLLQAVGPAFRFPHDELREWFLGGGRILLQGSPE